jgi:hypothetical protein
LSNDTVVRGLRVLAVLLLLYAAIQFWHQYYYWSGVYDPFSRTSSGSTYFHWEELWGEAETILEKHLGWARASVLALVLYVFIRGRSYWRGLAIGVPAGIVLAGLATGLGVYFGLTAASRTVSAEIGSVASEIRSIADEIGSLASEIGRFGPIDVNLNQ